MRLVKHTGLTLVLLCVLPMAAMAQTTAGSVSGTVTDPNGAVIPGVKIVATHIPTGREYTTVTTQAGLYVLPLLPTGPYTITVKHTGFKTYVQTGIEVRVDLRETIDIRLTLGTVQQMVEVKASAPVLETANATRGVGLSPQTLATLPLWNQGLEDASSFIAYMPGYQSNYEVSINGSVGRASEILIDGADMSNPESGGVNWYFPGFYAFSEMKMITSGFTAEDGRVGGGIQKYVSKSGTNAVHGALLFNFKRQFLDAVPFTTNAIPRTTANIPLYFTCGMDAVVSNKVCRPRERFNEEGGYAGGPVYIPHVYDGRNRTFWYFTWIGFWQPAAIAANTNETVPTQAMKQGNFGGIVDSKGNPIHVYDPANVVDGVRQQFQNDVIPTSRFSTIAKNILPYIPSPNAGAAGAVAQNFVYNQKTIFTDKVWSIKIDHSIHTRNRVSFFMTNRHQVSSTDQYMPGPLSNGLDSLQAPWYERASDDFIINPHIVLHTVWGFTQQRQFWKNPLQNGYGTKFGFPMALPDSQMNATPYISFTNDLNAYPTAWGMNQGKVNNGGQWNWTTMVTQTLTWIHDRHEFKMGWDIRRMRTTGNDWAGTNGSYVFNRMQTALANTGTGAASGMSFASFLLGAADSGSQAALPVFIGQTRYGYHAGFIQDTWKIRPTFTLNLGIRYEVPIGWHNVVGDYSSFSPTAMDPFPANPAVGMGAMSLPGAVIYMGSGPNRIGALRPYPTDFTDVGPRLGFAWNVRPSVVIRGAWGIFYQGLGNGGCGCEDGFGGGTYSQTSDGFNPAFYWDPGAYNPNKPVNNPGGVQPPPSFKPAQQIPGADNFQDAAGSLYYMGPHFGKAPRIYDYNFTIQKEYKNWLFEGAYSGVRGVGLSSSAYINTLPTSYLYLANLANPIVVNGVTVAPAGTNLLQTNILDYKVQCGYYNNCASGANPVLPFPTFLTWGGSATLNQALAPFPQYKRVFSANSGDGRNWYNSFQFKVEHRFGHLNLMASYVWSKALNVMSYRQIFTQTTQQGAQDSYNLRADKSYQIEDMPHVVNLMMSYQAPFGRGRRWLSNVNPVLNHLIGNWTFAMDGQYRSGGLVQILNPTNYLTQELFSTLTKATATGKPIRTGISTTSLDPGNSSIRFFNTGANAGWTTTPAGTLGNFSYYNSHVRQPWFRSENISLNKQIRIWESVLLNYQINVFNPFNRTDFSIANFNVTANNFGQAGGPMVDRRVITMGFRLEF